MSVKNCEDFLKYADAILKQTDDVFVQDAMLQLEAWLLTWPVTERWIADLERARNVVQTYLEYEMVKTDISKVNYVKKVKDYMDSVWGKNYYPDLWEYVRTLQPNTIKWVDTEAAVLELNRVADRQWYALYKYVTSSDKNLLSLFSNKTEYKAFTKSIEAETDMSIIKSFQEKFNENMAGKTGDELWKELRKIFGGDDTIEPEIINAFTANPTASTFTDLMVFKYIVSDTITFTSAISIINGLSANIARNAVDPTDITKFTKKELQQIEEVQAAEELTKDQVARLSTRQLEKLLTLDIRWDATNIIQAEFLKRTDENVKLDNEYIIKIEKLSEQENRIWKVWKNKVWWEYKADQSNEVVKKREDIIKAISEDYWLDASQAVDKFDELSNRRVEEYKQIFSKRRFSWIWTSKVETAQWLLAKDLAYASDEVKRSSLLNFLNEQKKNKQQLVTKDSLAMAYWMLATRVWVQDIMIRWHINRLWLSMRVNEVQSWLREYFRTWTPPKNQALANLPLTDKLSLLWLSERQIVLTIGNYWNDKFVYEAIEKQIVSKWYDFEFVDDVLSIERPVVQDVQKYQDVLFQNYTWKTIWTEWVNIDKIPEVNTRPPWIPTWVKISNDPRATVLVNDNPLEWEIKSNLWWFLQYQWELYYNPWNLSEFNYIAANLWVVQPRYAIKESIDEANKLQKQIVREAWTEMASTQFQRLDGVRDWVAILKQSQGRKSVPISHADMLSEANKILWNDWKRALLLEKLREYAPTLDNIDDLKPEELMYMMYRSDKYIYDYLARKEIKWVINTQDIIQNWIDNITLKIPKFSQALSGMYEFVARNIDALLPIIGSNDTLQVTLNKLQKLWNKNELIEWLTIMLKQNSFGKQRATNDAVIEEAIKTILPEITQAFEKARAAWKKAFVADVELLDDWLAFYKNMLNDQPIRASIAWEYFVNPAFIAFDSDRSKKLVKQYQKEYKDIFNSSDDDFTKTTRLMALKKNIDEELWYLLPTVSANSTVVDDIYTKNINPTSWIAPEAAQKNFDKLMNSLLVKIDESPKRFWTADKIARILDHGYTTIIVNGAPHRVTLDDAIIWLLEKNQWMVENVRLTNVVNTESVSKLTLEQKRSVFAMLTKQAYIDKKIKWNKIQNMQDVMEIIDSKNSMFRLIPHTMYNWNIVEVPSWINEILLKTASEKEQQEILMRWNEWSWWDREELPPKWKEWIPEQAFYDILFKNKQKNVFFWWEWMYEEDMLSLRWYIQDLDQWSVARASLDKYSRDFITVNWMTEPNITRNINDIDTVDIRADWWEDVYRKSVNTWPTPENTFTIWDCN